MTQSELTALIQRARTGEAQAQELLIREVQDRVYYHCKKMLKNESDAQDAAQDVLITVLTSLDRLREPAAFYGWVNGITANRCRHLLSRNVREWQLPENEDGESMLDSLEDLDQQAVPEAALENKETRRLVLELVDALPPDQRLCVLFYYYDEMSVREIAQAMETSEGTVKSRLNYARKSIKAGVEGLEKQGVRLYGAAPLPLLLLLLRQDALHSGLSAARSASLTSAVLSGASPAAGTTAAGAVAAHAGGAAARTGAALGTRIIAGVLAAVAAAGVITAAIQLTGSDEPPEEPPVQTEQPLPPEESEDGEAGEPESPALPEPPEDEGPSPELLALLDTVTYYGDKTGCRMTPEQASAFAQVIRQESAVLRQQAAATVNTCAALFDTGDGVPALLFGGGREPGLGPGIREDGSVLWESTGAYGVWEYRDGRASAWRPEDLDSFMGWSLILRDGTLSVLFAASDGSSRDSRVYPLNGGPIPVTPQTFAGFDLPDIFNLDDYRYRIEGAEVSGEEFMAWSDRWETQPRLCGQTWDGGVGGVFFGMGEAAAAADALEKYAAAGIPSITETGEDAPYAAAYAQKVRELLDAGEFSYRFALPDIDGDGRPELMASCPAPEGGYQRVHLYTLSPEMELYTVREGLTAGVRGRGEHYYPGENLILLDTAETTAEGWTKTVIRYEIGGGYTLEETDREGTGEAEPLTGTMTGAEILALLGE